MAGATTNSIKANNNENTITTLEDHEVVSISSKSFGSLPLFLPSNLTYDPNTNQVTLNDSNDDHDDVDSHGMKEEKKKPEEGLGNDIDIDDIENHHHHHPLVIVQNAGLEMIQEIQKQSQNSGGKSLCMIACVGPYRTGKSLLLSSFFISNKNKKESSTTAQQDGCCFDVGPTIEGCTRGIWISTHALRDKKTGTLKFLLDCEGMGDPLGGDEIQNTRIALSAILLSSVFIFNNSSHPDRGSLQFLRYLDTIRKRIQVTSQEEGNQQQQLQQLHYPSFLWVFRDFFLQLPYKKQQHSSSSSGGGGGGGKQQYTLKEYIVERVLNQTPSTTDPVLSPRYKDRRKFGSTSSRSSGGGGAFGAGVVDDVEGNVVDSLLHDFADFNVLKIGYPKRSGQMPFDPDELTKLGDVSFEEFDDDFQNDVYEVIKYCLDVSKPFTLGNLGDTAAAAAGSGGGGGGGGGSSDTSRWSWFGKGRQVPKSNYASPQEYARWCETVIELVNSEGIIPNIPDMQHQLLQRMANEQVNQCILDYTEQITTYLDGCPVYNNNGGNAKEKGESMTNSENNDVPNADLIQEYHLKGVAEQEELIQKSDSIMTTLRNQLQESISSVTILTESLLTLKMKCHDHVIDDATPANQKDDDDNIPTTTTTTASVLSQLLLENTKRSKLACETLAHLLYDPIRSVVREVDPSSSSPTSTTNPDFMTIKEFDETFSKIKISFQQQARGPSVAGVCAQLLDEPGIADRLLLEKNQMLHHSIDVQKQLTKDVQTKESELQDLQNEFEVTTKNQQEQIHLLQQQHQQAMEKAFEEQSKKLSALQGEMESKLKSTEERLKKEQEQRAQQLEDMKKDAESKLAKEIEAREERIVQEQKAFQDELENLRQNADKQMEEELKAAEERRIQQEQKLDIEMKQKLKDADDQLEAEQKRREDEIARVQNDMKKKEQEHQDLRDRLEEAEKKQLKCPSVCCCM